MVFLLLAIAPLSVIPFAQEAAGEVEHTMGVGQENGSSKQIFGLILYLETNILYILGNKYTDLYWISDISLSFSICRLMMFWATNMLSFSKNV